MNIRRVLVAGLLLVAISAPSVSASPNAQVAGSSSRVDVAEECSSLDHLGPDRFEVPVVGDWSTDIVLDVHVLLVGVNQSFAERSFREVAKLYETLNITIKPYFETVDLEIERKEDTSAMGTVLSTSDSQAFINASKEHFGGARPWWADVVYTMVGDELASNVAGQADCVGGIAYPDAAFAVGEVREGFEDYFVRYTAKIAGHEIAHLLAAHHHFMNCAEQNKEHLAEDGSACTLMANDLFLVSLAFSTLEGAVVRDWALEYAMNTPTSPPPAEPEEPDAGEPDAEEPGEEGEVAPSVARKVSFKIDKKWVARGKLVSPDGPDADCTEIVPIVLEKLDEGGAWSEVADKVSGYDSRFRFRLASEGTYRVKAFEQTYGQEKSCAEAVSRSVSTPN